MFDTLIVDTRANLAGRFKPVSPISKHMGLIIQAFITASGLPLEEVEAQLKCKGIYNVMNGHSVPTPKYMRLRNWGPIFAGYSAKLYKNENYGGLFKRYLNEESCTVYPQQLLVDEREDFSRPFAAKSPLAMKFAKIMREAVDASNKPVGKIKQILDCPSFSGVFSGAWIPTPSYMTSHKWLKKLEKLAPEIINKKENRAFLESYLNQQDCSEKPETIQSRFKRYSKRICTPARKNVGPIADTSADIDVTDNAAFETVETPHKDVRTTTDTITKPNVATHGAWNKEFLQPYTEAANLWSGDELKSATHLIIKWPNVWKIQNVEGKEALIYNAAAYDKGNISKSRWQNTAQELVQHYVHSQEDALGLLQQYRETCDSSRKGRKKYGYVLNSLLNGKASTVEDEKIIHALQWIGQRLSSEPQTTKNKAYSALIDSLTNVKLPEKSDRIKSIRFKGYEKN